MPEDEVMVNLRAVRTRIMLAKESLGFGDPSSAEVLLEEAFALLEETLPMVEVRHE